MTYLFCLLIVYLLLKDHDECGQNVDNCDETNGICTNIQGSFTCSCTNRFLLQNNGQTCSGKFTTYTNNTFNVLKTTNDTRTTLIFQFIYVTDLKILMNVTRTFLVAIKFAPTKPAPISAAATQGIGWTTTNTHA